MLLFDFAKLTHCGIPLRVGQCRCVLVSEVAHGALYGIRKKGRRWSKQGWHCAWPLTKNTILLIYVDTSAILFSVTLSTYTPYLTLSKYSQYRYSEVCRRMLLGRDNISEWIIESHTKPQLARHPEAHGILIDWPTGHIVRGCWGDHVLGQYTCDVGLGLIFSKRSYYRVPCALHYVASRLALSASLYIVLNREKPSLQHSMLARHSRYWHLELRCRIISI